MAITPRPLWPWCTITPPQPDGLKAEMEAAGVMDSFGLVDEWRLGWLDEAPQFIDYNSEEGGGQRKVAAGTGDACQTLLPENRECITVNMLPSWVRDLNQGQLQIL